MRTEAIERNGLRLVGAPPPGIPHLADPPLEVAAGRLDAMHLESLLLNLDDALRVRTRAQFFTWTQGLLQELIPHRVLVCALRRGSARAFTADGFSTLVADTTLFSDLLMRETPLASLLNESWRQHRYRPVLCSVNEFATLASNPCVRDLKRAGATDLLVHGSHDADGEVQGVCVFACQAGSIGPRQIYLTQLMAPSLHVAWLRTQAAMASGDLRASTTGHRTLTERE